MFWPRCPRYGKRTAWYSIRPADQGWKEHVCQMECSEAHDMVAMSYLYSVITDQVNVVQDGTKAQAQFDHIWKQKIKGNREHGSTARLSFIPSRQKKTWLYLLNVLRAWSGQWVQFFIAYAVLIVHILLVSTGMSLDEAHLQSKAESLDVEANRAVHKRQ